MPGADRTLSPGRHQEHTAACEPLAVGGSPWLSQVKAGEDGLRHRAKRRRSGALAAPESHFGHDNTIRAHGGDVTPDDGYASSHDCQVSCSQRSQGVQHLGLVAGPAALTRQETGRALCAVRADLPGLCGGTGDACGPKSPGFHPGGLGPHLTSSGFPGGLSSGFPFARRGSSPSPAFGWFPFVRRSSVCTLRPSPGSGSPSGSLPPGDLHVSAAAGRCRRRWSPVGKDQGHQFCPGPFAWVARDTPTLQAGSGRAREMPPHNRLVRAAASA
jgi:hypothetical protein